MPTAIVLSGGGSKGDFELGAVEYLYQTGIRPDILCGVSVGAVNAAKLAEGEDPADPQRGLPGLAAFWSALRTEDDMFREEEWLHDPDMDPDIRDALVGRSGLDIQGPRTDFPEWGTELGWLIGALSGISFLAGKGQAILKSIAIVTERARAIFNLTPIAEKLRAGVDPVKVAQWAAGGGRLRLGTVALESGLLRYVTESGQVVERDGRTVMGHDAVPAPCRPLLATVSALRDEIAALQVERAHAAPQDKGEISAQLREKHGDLIAAQAAFDTCVRSTPATPLTVDLRQGVLASASIPGVFVPIGLGVETYVDGGIREVLPLQVALDLGADIVYAVGAGRSTLSAAPSFANAKVINIVARGLTEITIDEINRDDRLARSPGTTVHFIEPDVDVHSFMTIDPGLIQIARDYGYMRAADVTGGVAQGSRRWQTSTEIALLRRQTWGAENQRWGQSDPTEPALPAPTADPSRQAEIDGLKARLQDIVNERRSLAGPMPEAIDTWSGRLERHRWEITVNDARFIGQIVPEGAPQHGQPFAVSMTMRNTGTTTWTAAAGYALGSQNPQDNVSWGSGRIGLPHDVAPGATVTFGWQALAANPPSTVFQWRMVRDGFEWFGEPTAARVVTVAEPTACPALRTTVAAQRQRIAVLTSANARLARERASAPPQEKGEYTLQIRENNDQIATCQTTLNAALRQAVDLGCVAIG